MIRVARPADAAAMDTFLSRFAETSMFLRGNLAAHGMEETTHRHGTRFFLADRNGDLSGVAGITNGGFLMCQTNRTPDDFHQHVAAALRGRRIAGMTGAPAQVGPLFDALGCEDAVVSLRTFDPIYRIEVADLDRKRHSQGVLRRPVSNDLPCLREWLVGYHKETGLGKLDKAASEGAAQAFLAQPDARVLVSDDQLAAMTSFNARTRETVQIGGVYVPPARRGARLGGAIVAQHLLESRAEGIERAFLFAATAYAARAYEAIGFKHAGTYEIVLFQEPWQVPK